MSRAGSRIRELARQRRNRAIVRFSAAGGLFFAPFGLSLILPVTQGIGVLIWAGCWVGAAVLYQQGTLLWVKAAQADQGAKGEEEVQKLLQTLQSQGWKIDYNIPLQYWGDADALLHSPKGNWFVVDTKSHKGSVVFDGIKLKRRYGRDVREFDGGKDLLQAIKGQSAILREMKRVRFVQPILCFTQANLEEIQQYKELRGVYVVAAANLVSLLKRLDNM